MDVILTQDVDNLGTQNDLVSVKAGYARNYLIPRGYAVVANQSNRKVMEEQRKHAERREEKLLSQLQEVIDKLKESPVTVGAKVGTSGKLFGTVTTNQIAEAIMKQKDIKIDRKKISLEEEVKALGTYTAKIDLHKDVTVDLSVEVVEG